MSVQTMTDVNFIFNLLSDKDKSMIYELILRLVPEDTEEPTEDEIEAIQQGMEDIKNGFVYDADEIDWDNLDKMNLD